MGWSIYNNLIYESWSIYYGLISEGWFKYYSLISEGWSMYHSLISEGWSMYHRLISEGLRIVWMEGAICTTLYHTLKTQKPNILPSPILIICEFQ